MHLNDLLDHFDNYTRLHISVNFVRDQLIDMGVQDEIRFHFVSIDHDILRGLLFRYNRHAVVYGDPIRCSEVCIAESLPVEWRRVVAVKELLHITDTPEETAESEIAVDKLIERMALPMEVREETRSSLNDRTHIIPALAILVPKQCRMLLREMHKEGKITPLAVAHMAKIPERYGDLILSEDFDTFVDGLRALNGRH